MGYGIAGGVTSSKMALKMTAILDLSINQNFSQKRGNVI